MRKDPSILKVHGPGPGFLGMANYFQWQRKNRTRNPSVGVRAVFRLSGFGGLILVVKTTTLYVWTAHL